MFSTNRDFASAGTARPSRPSMVSRPASGRISARKIRMAASLSWLGCPEPALDETRRARMLRMSRRSLGPPRLGRLQYGRPWSDQVSDLGGASSIEVVVNEELVTQGDR